MCLGLHEVVRRGLVRRLSRRGGGHAVHVHVHGLHVAVGPREIDTHKRLLHAGAQRTLDVEQLRLPRTAAWLGLTGSFAAVVGPWPVAASSSCGNELVAAACTAAAAAATFAS
jgi:hypothetical protein